ncbi:MAG: hypothetical protein EXS42_01650 [Lacunisphaera sp.]|nr:hypothetical protein [Lacunisphaera sp.]
MASRLLIAAFVCSLTALPRGVARNTPDKLGGLLANPPFGLSRTGAAGSAAAEPLEFRAVLEENGNRIFSIYDTSTHQSNWVDLNDPVKEFSVKEYDAEHASVTVEYQGKLLKLALNRAAPVAAAPLPGSAVPPTNRMAQVTQKPVAPQQLQQIQEEIRRRRALRQPPVTPASNAAPPPPTA